MKKPKKFNYYHLFSETEPTQANHYYPLGEQVRAAFVGLTRDLYDHIHIITPNAIYNYVTIKIVGKSFISLCGGHGFDFLSTSVFYYQKMDKEPWTLEVSENESGFGRGMSVSAKTPRECVKAMINERKKFLKRHLAALNRFRSFEDYTYNRHRY